MVSDVAQLARDVARELAEHGVPQDERQFTKSRTEERTSGMFGRKKESVTVNETVVEKYGWLLWRQQVEDVTWDMPLGSGNHQFDKSFFELWLRPSGEIEFLHVKTETHPGSGSFNVVVESREPANDHHLDWADRAWEHHVLPYDGFSYQSERQTWTWGAQTTQPNAVRKRLESLRREAAARAAQAR